ncbi:MAG TPA: SDR family oxidoreductase [Bryobacteraceae bacterium]|nr:SDR family oxidoreductase [Bryobacteraceae bacterium]
MNKPKNVLITGHNGYVGSVMAARFAKAGHIVLGLDTEYYSQCTLNQNEEGPTSILKDIRDVEPRDLEGVDAIVHLAALSNDPIGNLNDAWTEDINFRASVRLAEAAKAAGVSRFLFSSSCIMYGMSETAVVNENSPLDPRTTYARSKVEAERAIAKLADERFSPTFLRNGTIYGLSPRMRFDTVLNNLMGAAVTSGVVTVHSDGQPWRPVVHVEDVARAFLTVLDAPRQVVHNQAFNVGAAEMNQQIIRLAEITASIVPNCKLQVKPDPGADQRTYKTDFTKFAVTFPAFSFAYSPLSGARQLYQALKGIRLTAEEFADKRFTRLKWLQYLLESGRVNGSLRWAEVAVSTGARL